MFDVIMLNHFLLDPCGKTNSIQLTDYDYFCKPNVLNHPSYNQINEWYKPSKMVGLSHEFPHDYHLLWPNFAIYIVYPP